MSGVYGSIVTGKDVREAVRDTIKLWIRDYLGEVARNSGRGSNDLLPFRSYSATFEMDKFEEDALPACVIVAPGLMETPQKRSKEIRARWGVGVGVVVSGQSRENTFELCELYAAATRALLLHNPSLGKFAQGVDWIDERYDELGSEDLRTIAAGTVQFGIDVHSAVELNQGPRTPTAPPAEVEDPGEWGTVQSHHIETNQRS